MSKIYKYTDSEQNSDYLVSKEYVDLRFKRLEDAMSKPVAPILDNVESIEMDSIAKNVKGCDIKQDSSNRMLTDAQVSLFRRKPSSHEIDSKINDMATSLKRYVDEIYTKLLNMPNAVSRLKLISTMVSQNDELEQFFAALDNTVSIQEFKDHINNNFHMTNNERKALNILLDLLKDGFADKIKDNKNLLETVLEDLKKINSVTDNKVLEKVIYNTENYTDILPTNTGILCFKPGKYIFDDGLISESKNQTIITGSGIDTTKFMISNSKLKNCYLKDLTVEALLDSTDKVVELWDWTKINNCRFSDCDIRVMGNNINISDCRFDGSKISFSQYSSNMIIKDSFFNKSIMPKMLGIGIIIKDNFFN